MNFTSVIVVQRSVDETWEFLSNPLNASKWDRSVARVILPESGFTGKDCRVITVSPGGMHQPFVITAFQPPLFFSFRLLESAMFRQATLSFRIEKTAEGTRVKHEIEVKLLPRMFFLYPVLLLTQKRALRREMKNLRKALENDRNFAPRDGMA